MDPKLQSGQSAVPLLRASGLTKIFPGKVANRNVSLDIFSGEVHALLGENGAGKSTLVGMIAGMLPLDGGEILWRGYSPLMPDDAKSIAPHIGMVHQHFSLVSSFTLVENLMLLEPFNLLRPFYKRARVKERLAALAEQFGLSIPVDKPVGGMSVGEQQLGELLKALYFDCELLILDEPTAVLTPGEIKKLWAIIRNFSARGRAVIIIAHKISEVMEVADRITVLRDGEVVSSMIAADATPGGLAEMMVGRGIRPVKVAPWTGAADDVVLELDEVCSAASAGRKSLLKLNLKLRAGEIVGVAGVDGNGQRELFHLLAAHGKPSSGSVRIGDALRSGAKGGVRAGRIPDDRQRYGLVMGMSVRDNLMLASGTKPPFSRAGFRLRGRWTRKAEALVEAFDIRCASVGSPARSLSGGNQQKLILARELSGGPDLLLVANPTRGLDIGAIEMIHVRIIAAAAQGCAVLLISADLDEVLTLSHRVLVMHGGSFMGTQQGPDYDLETLGLWMAGREAL